MDFRISRLKTEKEILTRRGLNVVKERDYSKPTQSWNEGVTKEVFSIEAESSTTIEQIIARRNELVGIAIQNRVICEAGSYFTKEIIDFLGDTTFLDYAIMSGIINQIGNGHEPNEITRDAPVRIMWYGHMSSQDFNTDIVTSVRNRWDDLSYGSLLKKDAVEFAGKRIQIQGNDLSDEHSELHLSWVDIDARTMEVCAVFTEDRSVSEYFFCYIPPAMGGKPSKMTKVNSCEKFKIIKDPIDLKEVRRLKIKEVQRVSTLYPVSNNMNQYLEYLKDFGHFNEVIG